MVARRSARIMADRIGWDRPEGMAEALGVQARPVQRRARNQGNTKGGGTGTTDGQRQQWAMGGGGERTAQWPRKEKAGP